MRQSGMPPCLIVNADDYGYFHGVSQGILDAADRGIVTATGVFANSERFDEDVPALRDCATLDAGVHLNLTDGRPLTADMRDRLARWGGRFPRKFTMARAVMLGVIRPVDVEVEWRAQIERCRRAGLKLHFLNSHEHIHMLPALFRLAQGLADEFRIPHLRFATTGLALRSVGGALRAVIVETLAAMNRRRLARPAARFVGLEASGRLRLSDLDAVTSNLQPGGVYELMCHPGRPAAADVNNPRLLAYHDWEGELATLTDPRAKSLLESRGIRLVGYRDIAVDGGRLSAKTEGQRAQA